MGDDVWLDTLLMLVVKYAFFALISTVLNLSVQALSFVFYSGTASLYMAMIFGTAAGLLSKYILDKRYIFYHTPQDRRDDVQKFLLYSTMGLFTTMIFWGTEIAFNAIFLNPYAKYFGAAVGLSVGYILKYFLDRRYVFIEKKGGVL